MKKTVTTAPHPFYVQQMMHRPWSQPVKCRPYVYFFGYTIRRVSPRHVLFDQANHDAFDSFFD